MNYRSYLHTVKELFITDCKILKFTIWDKLINIAIWTMVTIFVNGYLLPQLGIAANFGVITFAGMLAAAGVFEGYGTIAQLIADLLHEKILYYYATLPIPVWLLFMRMILFNAFLYALLTITLMPLGKLLLWSTFDLSVINWFYFFIALLVSNLFFGAFSLFTASFIAGFHQMGNVWSRFVFPLWFLGGFAFPWYVLYKAAPIFAYLDLLNPLIYISEAYRVALLGQEGYLNFWLCMAMIMCFGVLAGLIGSKRLKKRCDFI